MIKVTVRGSFKHVEAFGKRMLNREQFRSLEKFGPQGVAALAAATPKDSNIAASSWTYETVNRPGYYAIHWYNTDTENGFNVAVMLQYGHGTRNGGYVQGRDYINPAMRPIFDQMANEMWKVVTK